MSYNEIVRARTTALHWDKTKLSKSVSKLEPSASLCHTLDLQQLQLLPTCCHRYCKLKAKGKEEENTATWWKRGIGNICNCSK